MSNVLSLAMKINADASGFKLDPVQRALQGLAKEADKVTKVFDEFAGSSEAAARAQAKTAADLERLTQARQAGTVTAQEFEKQFNAIAEAAGKEADALRRAAQITEANLTPTQRYERAVAELDAQLKAGRISQETYNAAVAKAKTSLDSATASVDKQKLKFNELSGVLSALPGPFGSIAGRISGLSSAGEGLGRVFSGGLSQGISSIGTSIAGLANPLTLAVAGVAAFGAAATAITQGLTALEDRVENLGNIADKLGVSFGFIQTLEEAANRSGTSIDAVSAAFGRLQKSVLGVDEESKAAQKALAEIGVTAEELQALSPEEQYRLIGESLAAIEDPARRTATATALFGKSGADLLPFFRNLGVAAEDMRRLNGALSEVDRTRIDGLGNAFDGVNVALRGLGNELLTPFIGIAQSISDTLGPAIAAFGRNIGAVLDIFSPLTSALGLVINLVGQVATVVQNVIGTVLEPFATVGRGVSGAFDAISQSITAVFKPVNDVVLSFREFFKFEGVLSSVSQAFSGLGDTVSRVFTIISTAFSKVGEFVGNLARRFADLIAQSPLLRSIGETVSAVFGGVSSVFQTISNAIGGTVGRLLTMAERFLGINREAKGAADGVGQVAAAADQVTQLGAKSQEALSKAIEQVGEYGQAGFEAALKYQEALREVDAMIAEEGLTEEQAARARANVTAEYERQIDVVKQASEEKKRAAEEAERAAKREADAIQSIIDKNLEQIRIEQQFGGDAARARNADDLVKIREEIARTEQQIREANARGDEEAAARAAARLAQLDQVESRLADAEANFAERADQTAQGFADGFDRAFEATTRGLDDLINRAAQFGNEGALAAQQLQDGIARAQEAVRAGILSRDAYEAEVAAQRKLAEEKLAQIDRENKARQAQIAAEFQAQVAANERLNQFMMALDGGRQQAEAAAAEEAAKRRQEAVENLAAIEERIATQRQAIEAAREQNDLKSAKARREELKQLEALRKQEQAIADGRVAASQKINSVSQANAQAQAAQQEAFTRSVQQQVGSLQAAAGGAIEATNQAFAKAADRQRKLISELNNLGSRTISVPDARTAEGAALILGLGANALDPRLVEARLTNKILREVVTGLAGNLDRIGIPAAVL